MDLNDQLEQINIAISKIEGGCQEYTINGRRYVRPDLSKLYSERSAIQSQIAAVQNSGFGLNTFVARFDRR